jgi:glycerophosphoryl diester phosphodiesterase
LQARGRSALISVHRGLWSQAPENSLAAIRAAAGYGIIEIDAQLSCDGVPVVIHDADLIRTTGLAGRVSDTDHASLTALPLLEGDGGPGAATTKETLPTLDQALRAAGPDDYFDIDVKHPHEVEAIAAFLARNDLQTRGSLKISTANPGDIDRLLSLQTRYGMMVMAKVNLPEVGPAHIRDLTRAGVAAAEVFFDDLDQMTEACQIGGTDMAISTYTLDPVHCCGLCDSLAQSDPEAVWGTLLDAGVTILMTDLAPELARFLDQRV